MFQKASLSCGWRELKDLYMAEVETATTEERRGGEGGGIKKSYFDVLGICCPSEVPLIERILMPLEGIHKVSVSVPSKTVIVEHDPNLISQLQIGMCNFFFFGGRLPFFFHFLWCLFGVMLTIQGQIIKVRK